MSDDLQHSPVAFTSNVEVRADDEAETIQGLNEQLRLIQEKTAQDYGTAVRGVHAKGHAIVKGKLEVLSGIAPALAQGLFSTPGSYDALRRFSTLPGDIRWECGLSEQQEQAVSFSPWHGLVAHQPIGGVNRARKPTYETSTQFRGQHNGMPRPRW